MIFLNLDQDDCSNLSEFAEIYIFNYFKDLFDQDEIDNRGFIKSIMQCLDELEAASKGLRNISSYTPLLEDEETKDLNEA